MLLNPPHICLPVAQWLAGYEKDCIFCQISTVFWWGMLLAALPFSPHSSGPCIISILFSGNFHFPEHTNGSLHSLAMFYFLYCSWQYCLLSLIAQVLFSISLLSFFSGASHGVFTNCLSDARLLRAK